MNKIKKVVVYSFCTLLSIFATSCKETKKEVKCVEMQKLNGEWIKGCYDLPVDGFFYIKSYQGSYWLEYNGMNIRAGIIDYR